MNFKKIGSDTQKVLEKWSRRIKWRMHWLLPNHISSPVIDSAYNEQHDRETNKSTSIPDAVKLRLSAIWAVEIYGPAEIEGLYSSMKKLSWTAGGFGRSEDEVLNWIKMQRAYGYGGNINVGMVVRPSKKKGIFGTRNHAELPEGINHLLVKVHQATPAVTCMTVGFVFDEKSSKEYECLFSQKYKTRAKRRSSSVIEYLDPSHLKQQELARLRQKNRVLLKQWFAKNIPGYFAQTGDISSFPLTEILSTSDDGIYLEKTEDLHFNWRKILSNTSASEVWTNSGYPFLKFNFFRPNRDYEVRNFSIAAISLNNFPTETAQMYAGSIESTALYNCQEVLGGALLYNAILAYLKEISRNLKATREELTAATISRKRTLQVIHRIQVFFDKNSGTATVAREINEHVKTSGQIRFYVGSFSSPDIFESEKHNYLADQLEHLIRITAKSLIEDESSTREQLEQLTTVLSVKESIYTQRKMELLTIVALLIAVLSFFAAIPEKWTQEILSFFN